MLDLTKGNPFKVMVKYILPLFGSVVFQQLYNIADSIVAGKFIGESALAAVGNSYEITLIYLAFAIGCNMGASVITARYYGAKDYSKVKTCISTSFIYTIIVCLSLVLIGFLASPSILKLLNTPDEIFDDTLLYLNIYTGGLIFLFVYNVTTGLFAALGDSKTPFVFLVISSLSNIGMDILFVKVFEMGIAGVAWATFICQGISCIAAFIFLMFTIKKLKTDKKPKAFDKQIFKEFLEVAIPSTLQQSFVSVGNIILQSLINSFGTSTIAGYSAAVKFNNFAVTCFVTCASGISNYTAQNLGADKIYRVKDGYKYGMIIALAIALPFILVYSIAGNSIMLLFLNKDNVEAINVGVKFLSIVSPFYIFATIKLAADGVFRGASRMVEFMIGTLIDLIVRVGLSFIFARTELGSTGIWLSWPFGWFPGMVLSTVFYLRKKWQYSATCMRVEYVRES